MGIVDDVFVVGVGMTPFGKFLDRSIKDLSRQAITGALEDAACDMASVNGAYFANTSQGHMEGQGMIKGQCALQSMGFEGIPIVNLENACASASTAFVQAIQFGEEVVVTEVHLSAGQRGDLTVHGFGSEVDEVVLVIAGATPYTTELASYDVSVLRIPEP